MNFIEVQQGDSPLVLGLPHTGTDIPQDCAGRMNDRGLRKSDTDWHIHRLYDDLVDGVTSVRTTVHRYVIDVNRDPSGQSLYPGQNTTGLCPITDFDGAPIYRDGLTPDAEEIERRRVAFHAPYHTALETELERVRTRHGFAVLYDCHSIRSHIPFLFDGRLPDFNIGTNEGRSCAAQIEQIVHRICTASDAYTTVCNGRFKGGWTTRHYGKPDANIHAVQMELAQATYMQERPPWTYDASLAAPLRARLALIMTELQNWRPQ